MQSSPPAPMRQRLGPWLRFARRPVVLLTVWLPLSLVVLWQGLVLYEEFAMAFKVGDRAPDFSATTQDGGTVRLADFVGKRGLVLFFYPKDGTAICTKEACAFRDSYEQFVDAGAEVIGVSSDNGEQHRSFAQEHRLSFPLISDTDGAMRKTFAVPKTLGLFPGRVTYVIDKEGTIRQVYSAQLASDEHVRQALAALGVEKKAK